ncbi:MAG: bifunctional 5,10-methylenetetrahydrofolate dehydrogenase/5,10-methenyltetrahydrofolate cyclohydrolase [Candidatus Gracilibacteria bacterium]|jgi:methylenetetrahydrofolate dehydrogenase (NADP+)/methenyltetrahydrofolate cyclohydrolase
MSAKILDGRLVSDFLLKGVGREVARLKASGISPKLVIILVGNNPASLSYVRQKDLSAHKTGMDYEQLNLDEKVTTEKLVSIIEKLNKDKSVHGILVQLPLPKHISVPLVIKAIDPAKDVDGFQAYNLGKMFTSLEFEHLVPCTPKGIIEMLEFYKISPAGKHVVIVGRSNLVGKPLSVMLLNRDATVTVCHSKTKNLAKFTSTADILVAAVGKPRMIKAKMVKRGAVVIDVGTTKVKDKLTGDVDFEKVKAKASFITPVPGGIGPMTVASLMDNVVKAAKRQAKAGAVIKQMRPS